MNAPNTPKVEIIRRPNRLKAKVSGSESAGPGVVPMETVARAQEVVAEFSSRYPAQAEIDLTQLATCFQRIVERPEDCAADLRALQLCAREIMGQAETFGFLLLTRFARSLYDFCDELVTVSERQQTILKAHTDAMHLVVRQRIRGDGGAIGRQLAASLAAAKEKLH